MATILDNLGQTLQTGGVCFELQTCWSLIDEHTLAKCAMLVKIVRSCLKIVSIPAITTYRDIFYQDVRLYQSQARATAVIQQFSKQVGVDPITFGVMASQKGLMGGAGNIITTNGSVQVDNGRGVQLIPSNIVRLDNVNLIVAFEKDAILSKFLYHSRNLALPSNILYVSGKGFPDKVTQNLSHIAQAQGIPQIVFVDLDVYGLMISQCYAGAAYAGVEIISYNRGWVDTNNRERVLAANFMANVKDEIKRRELQRGWIVNKKAELNLIDGIDGLTYITQTIEQALQVARGGTAAHNLT